ncbi:MAG: hypothetical protein K6F27_10945 [Ruminococcus sp.]|nr:hypothetical protein [Ruminococcus sp.]
MNFFGKLYSMHEKGSLNIRQNVNIVLSDIPPIRVSAGLSKAVEKFLRDILKNKWRLGIAVDNEGTYWSRSVNHNETTKQEIICCFNPPKKNMSLAIQDSTGALKQYDEKRVPYECMLPLIGYFWKQKTVDYSKYDSSKDYVWSDIQGDIKYIIKEYKTNGNISETMYSVRFMSLLYYIGKELFDTEMGNFEEVRYIPTSGEDITQEMFADLKTTTFFFDEIQGDVDVKNDDKTSGDTYKTLEERAIKVLAPYHKTLTDEQKALVPKHRDDFIVTQQFTDIATIMLYNLEKGRKNTNALFEGDPGCGKTASAIELAALLHIPCYIEQGFESKDAGDYQGTTIAKDGALNTTSKTPFAAWAVGGGMFIDDDSNYVRAGENIFKNSMLEEPFKAKLADFTEIERNPFTVYIATVNPNCSGAREIPSAFKNRAFIDVMWTPLSDEEVKQHIIEKTGLKDVAKIDKMIDSVKTINNRIGKGINKKEEAENLTLRNLVDWADLTQALGGDPLRAANFNLIAALGANASDELVKWVWDAVLKPRFQK